MKTKDRNKIQVTDFSLEVDMMSMGCVVDIEFCQDDVLVVYRITASKRILSIDKRFRGEGWKSMIPEDFTMNPLSITENELLLVDVMMMHLSDFERSLFRLASTLAKMFYNNASEEYARRYINKFVDEFLDIL